VQPASAVLAPQRQRGSGRCAGLRPVVKYLFASDRRIDAPRAVAGVAPDMATFQDFVTHLTAAPHVRNVRTSLVLHNSKYEAAVPLEVKVAG
jgi:hypothetical protein